ncbi:S1 family peptidase [Devosia sp.]|uniref:S1 family peptidase n=1 Tax=Devosia sp. TaxID=1871048 RepID=UPI002FC86BD7
MLGNIQSIIIAEQPKEIAALLDLLNIVSNKTTYEKFLGENSSNISEYERRKSILSIGMFSGLDFTMLVMEAGKIGGTNVQLLSHLLRRLCDWLMVSDNGLLGSNMATPFRWEENRIRLYLSLGLVDNVLLGQGYIAEKYRRSTPPIIVQKRGDILTGTGFLVGNPGSRQRLAIVTAAHNVDPRDGIEVISIGVAGDTAFHPKSENWSIHPSLDIAAIPVEAPESCVPIWPLGQPTVLARTVTLGYPRIATTDGPYLLAHSGEINAVVNSYHGERKLIISNLVAPGNSGGPVLDEAGLCVGMVVNSFETEHQGGKSVANAAIPAASIMDFVLPMLT